jgi:methanogenic corrinoid protein MtbC1
MEKLQQLQACIEYGKGTQASPYPPEMKGQPGAVELTRELLAEGVAAEVILNEALIPGMRTVGRKFQCHEAFVPDMLISADAMKKAMVILKDELAKSKVEPKGTFIIGTVEGDMHDIGKNLVAMMVEGAGWKVVDLGVDVAPDKFVDAVDEHPGATVGLSALLTTTMGKMKTTLEKLRSKNPGIVVLIGGAPVSDQYANEINASGFAPDPQGAIELLEKFSMAG